MAEKFYVKGYEQFVQFMKDLKADGKITNVLFSGEKDSNGTSWCPDCVVAEPFINNALDQFGENTIFVTVDVGERSTWKDMDNKFRKDKDTHLSVIPTLIRWKNPQRLEGDQLLKPELLQMFFADED